MGAAVRGVRGGLRVPHHSATTEPFLGDTILHDFAGTFLQGLALRHASQNNVAAVALVVLDSTESPSSGGMQTFVENWRRTGREARIIDLAALRRGVTITAPPLPASPTPLPRGKSPRTVQAMLFSDVVGFSGVPEQHLPDFHSQFLSIVEETRKGSPRAAGKHLGDALYAVFRTSFRVLSLPCSCSSG